MAKSQASSSIDEPSQMLDMRADGQDGDTTETTQLLGSESQNSGDGTQTHPSEDTWEGYSDFEGFPWWRKPSVVWLLGPFTIFTLAFGGVIVPKLNLILDLVCRKYFADQQLADPNTSFNPVLLGSDNPQCKIPEVQASVATFMLVMSFVTGGLSAIVAPRMGRLSDRYGRTRLLALASVGGVIAEFITILAAKFPETVNYRWLVVGSIFDGLTGSFTAGSILTQSYASDCTPPSKRAVSLGYMHACLYGGLAFGPLIAGYFAKWTGNLLSVFYVVFGCHILFILVVLFVVPESLSKRKQDIAKEKWKKEHDAHALTRPEYNPSSGAFSITAAVSSLRKINPFKPLKALWPTGPGTTPALRRNLVALAANDMIIMGSSMAAGAVIILYSEYTFDWGNLESSRFISALSLVRVVVLMAISPIVNYFGRVRPAARRECESGIKASDTNSGADTLDIWILRVALFSDILGSIGYTLARRQEVFFASGMVTALGGLGSATVQAVITKHVPSDRVGELLGAVGMLHALARLGGPVLFNGLYAATVKVFPQAIFVLLTSLFVFGLITTSVIRSRIHWEYPKHEDEAEPLIPDQPVNKAFGTNGRLSLDDDQILIQ